MDQIRYILVFETDEALQELDAFIELDSPEEVQKHVQRKLSNHFGTYSGPVPDSSAIPDAGLEWPHGRSYDNTGSLHIPELCHDNGTVPLTCIENIRGSAQFSETFRSILCLGPLVHHVNLTNDIPTRLCRSI